ncbi:MAG: hypothetical protein WC333_00500 [Dehalococcoidia bacterium]|jgi:hypothetical protein
MKTVESVLEPVTGYLLSMERNPEKGWYELKVGIPKSWVYGDNKSIGCEIITETDEGKLIKISPKNYSVVIDDLISFVEAIVRTNKKIAEKEKLFNQKVEQMKGAFEKEAKKFYDELELLKVNSFKNLTETLQKSSEKKPSRKKPLEKPVEEPKSVESKEKESVNTETTLLELE